MELKELHEHFFDMLCMIDDICRKENVKYFLAGGTQIGAVREHDFIEWDDDVDIMVLREDYPAFKAAMEKHLPDDYVFLKSEELEPNFYDFIPRIIAKNIDMRVETDEDRFYNAYRNKVFVDVFIMEHGPDDALRQKLYVLKCKTLYGMAMSKRYKLDYKKYTFMQKLMVFVCSTMGRMFSMNKINKMWNKAITKYNNKKTKRCILANDNLRVLIFYDTDMFEEAVYFPIRGRDFPVPKGYDKELRMHYGDYMTPEYNPDYYIQHL